MTVPPSEFESTVRRLTVYWPLVLVAVLVAAAAGVVYAKVSSPAVPYQATAPVAIVALGANTRGPSPDGVRVAATLPAAKAAVVASLGPDATAGIGAITAAVDTKDATLVRIVVSGTNAEKTRVFADALARVAVNMNQAAVSGPARTYSAVASHDTSVASSLAVQIEKLQALVAQNPKDSTLLGVLISAQAQQASALDQAKLYQLNADLWNGTVSYPSAATVARASRRGAYITGGLQGGIIGLAVGLVIAWIADRMRGRKTTETA